jgi:hypothetical protein
LRVRSSPVIVGAVYRNVPCTPSHWGVLPTPFSLVEAWSLGCLPVRHSIGCRPKAPVWLGSPSTSLPAVPAWKAGCGVPIEPSLIPARGPFCLVSVWTFVGSPLVYIRPLTVPVNQRLFHRGLCLIVPVYVGDISHLAFLGCGKAAFAHIASSL